MWRQQLELLVLVMLTNKVKKFAKGLVADQFGSRRGFSRHCKYSMMYRLGRYNRYRLIDWGRVNRLVFVCKGNICRSAFAEAVAIDCNVNAISCGIDTVENTSANPHAIRMAEQFGYNLKEHKTTPTQLLSFSKTDLLIAMEPLQVEFLERHLGVKYNCTLLGLWSNPALPYIHDPYGLSEAYFNNCFSFIERSTREIIKHVDKRN